MRCTYLSDLHLESQDFPWTLPGGDVLIIAGDLCHAIRLDPARDDKYSTSQRDRVHRFADAAGSRYEKVILVAGNHDHYDGIFGDTIGHLRRWLPDMIVLDDDTITIDGACFFGGTLWSDFEGRRAGAMDGVRKRMGEYFFVKVRTANPDGAPSMRKLRPEDAADAFDATRAALHRAIAAAGARPVVVVTHHAPSLQGCNPHHKGNGLDGAYASDLDADIARLASIRFWVHGHTHIRRAYRIGDTRILTNARGFDGRDPSARTFTPAASFEL